jgi:hypothetical protein
MPLPITPFTAFIVTFFTEKKRVFRRKKVIHSYPKMDNEKNAEKIALKIIVTNYFVKK